MDDEYKDWTRYHIIHTLRNQWKFYREGMKRSIKTASDRNAVIKVALNRAANHSRAPVRPLQDGTVDFVVDNWVG